MGWEGHSGLRFLTSPVSLGFSWLWMKWIQGWIYVTRRGCQKVIVGSNPDFADLIVQDNLHRHISNVITLILSTVSTQSERLLKVQWYFAKESGTNLIRVMWSMRQRNLVAVVPCLTENWFRKLLDYPARASLRTLYLTWRSSCRTANGVSIPNATRKAGRGEKRQRKKVSVR